MDFRKALKGAKYPVTSFVTDSECDAFSKKSRCTTSQKTIGIIVHR